VQFTRTQEQTIFKGLGGRDPRNVDMVDLQAYTTFYEVCMLAHKVE